MADNNQKLNSSLKFLAKSSLVVLVGIFLSKIFNYLYRIIIARYFGPEVYGIFSLAFIILGLFVSVSSLGLSDGLLRFVSFYRGKKRNYNISFIVKLSLLISLLSSITAGVILFSTSEIIALGIVHNPGIIPYLKVFSFLIPINVLSNLFLYLIRAYEKIGSYSFLNNVVQYSIRLAILVLLILTGLSVNPVIASFFLSITLLLLLSFLFCKFKLPGVFAKSLINKKQKKELSRKLFSYSWPIIFVGVIANIFYWTDSLVLGYFKTASDVGLYNVAAPLASLLGVAPELFMQLFFPMISFEYSRKNFPLIKELSKQIGKWIFIINLPLFYLMLFFPQVIINLLFGSEYLVVDNVLRMLSLASFVGINFTISNSLLSMIGKSRTILINFSVFTVFNLVLNILLIPKYGMQGAAFSTVLSFFLLTLVTMFQAWKFTGVLPFRRKMLRIFFVSLIVLIPALVIRSYISLSLLGVFIFALLFFIAYSLILFFTRCLDRNDLEVLRAFKRKLGGLR